MSKADVIEIEGTVVEKLPKTPCFRENWKMDTRCLHISVVSCVRILSVSYRAIEANTWSYPRMTFQKEESSGEINKNYFVKVLQM